MFNAELHPNQCFDHYFYHLGLVMSRKMAMLADVVDPFREINPMRL